MARKVSVRGAVRDALRDERREVQRVGGDATRAASSDSFVNFAQKLGVGADNALSSSTYGFNPITRQRVLLEWIHRGSWLGGVAIDVVADDMTREGIEYVSEMPPEDSERLDHAIQRLGCWQAINDTIKWGRLYGGALGVILVDGQDMTTPLDARTIGPGAFRGVLPLDRWMVEPVVEDLVTELGPHLGLPRFYRVGSNAPALRGKSVHHSRCLFRTEGVRLPYQQRLTENLWGVSVLERLYDRMIAYDSASTGAAQLVYKSYLRTLSVEGMREIVSAGGAPLSALVKYTEMMRRFQGIEGITLIDSKDKFEVQQTSAFSGIKDVMGQLAEQLSGALQIPLTRLFGQSPSGFSDGDNDMRNYYDGIKQRQERDLHRGVVAMYRCAAISEGVTLPDNFAIRFRSLWQLTATDKSNIAKTATDTVLAAHEAGLVSDQVALQELRQSSRETGVWTNITSELIDAAETEAQPPGGEGGIDPATGMPIAPGAPKIPGVPNFAGSGGEDDGRQGEAPASGALDPREKGGEEVRGPAAAGGQAGAGDPAAARGRLPAGPARDRRRARPVL